MFAWSDQMFEKKNKIFEKQHEELNQLGEKK